MRTGPHGSRFAIIAIVLYRPTSVLVADDDPGTAETLADLLTVAGEAPIEAVIALDGSRAVESALATRPQIAIFDIEMPVMDGIQAALAIRAELGADAPLMIALTGNAQRASQAETLRAFDHALVMPADVDTLLALTASVTR